MAVTDPDPAESPPVIDRAARRVSIVGSSGSGKTYLARHLSLKRGVKHIELDELRQLAQDESQNSQNVFVLAVGEVADEDSWIIDGHYRDIRHLVWQRADLVIYLDYPLPLIARQLLKRYFSKVLGPLFSKVARKSKTRSKDTKSGKHKGPKIASASWSRRFARIGKTLAERREYDVVLSSPEYRGVRMLKFRNPRAAFEWIDSL